MFLWINSSFVYITKMNSETLNNQCGIMETEALCNIKVTTRLL